MNIEKLIGLLKGACAYIKDNYDYGDDDEKKAITEYVTAIKETIQLLEKGKV